MTARTALALAGIALVVAGLAAYRCACRVGPSTPGAAPVTETAPRGPSTASLPVVLDFGRDT